MGTRDEVGACVEALRRLDRVEPSFRFLEASRAYPNRTEPLQVRLYVDAEMREHKVTNEWAVRLVERWATEPLPQAIQVYTAQLQRIHTALAAMKANPDAYHPDEIEGTVSALSVIRHALQNAIAELT